MSNIFHSSRSRTGGAEGSEGMPTRGEVLAREKEEFGGVKIGSAIFGWLTATGTAVLIATLLSAAGAALVAVNNTTPADVTANANTSNAIVAGIVLMTVLFVSYYCGGYVAGRMARFNGMRQGIAVWVVGVCVAIVISIVGAVANAQTNVLASLQMPNLPINADAATTGAWILFLGILAVTLLGAILGGLAGMHFHRKVDQAGYVRLPH